MNFLLNHRDFHVRDWRLASLNYDVQVRSVIERARRLDVYEISPRHPGRSSFEIRVDPAREVIVGQREFDAKRSLVLEWEYESLVVGSEVEFPDAPDWFWTPIRPIAVHADVDAAMQAVAAQFRPKIPGASQLPAGFSLAEVRTTFEPMRKSLYLVLDYTDGISSLFLIESAAKAADGMVPAMPGLPSADPRGAPTIFRYVEGGHSQCWTTREDLHLLVVSRVTGQQIPDLLVSLLR